MSTLMRKGVYVWLFSHVSVVVNVLPILFVASTIFVGPLVRITGALCIQAVRDKAAIY